jgi:hypothetical protein
MSGFGDPPPPPSDGAIPMAPRRPSEIVSAAFAIFQQHWRNLILISIVYVAILFVVGLVVALIFGALAGTVAGATIAALVSVALFLVASFALTGAVTRLVASEVAGVPTTVSDSVRYGVAHIGPIAGVSLLVFAILVAEMLVGVLLIAATGAGALVIPVILGAAFLGFVFSMAIPALVVESKTGTEALSRSWQLILSNFGHALGTFALAYLVVFVVGTVVGIIGAASPALQTILNLVLQVVLLPFFSLVLVLLYVNLRVKTGGLTQETLREELRRSA